MHTSDMTADDRIVKAMALLTLCREHLDTVQGLIAPILGLSGVYADVTDARQFIQSIEAATVRQLGQGHTLDYT